MKFSSVAIVGAAGAAAQSVAPAYGAQSSRAAPPVYGAPTTSAPAAGYTASNGGYVCNPAHSYPAGASCDSNGATPTLVYPSSTPVAGYTASNSGYVCNPAHSYPAGASCDSNGATPTLVYPSSTPVAGYTASNGGYVCNPAHSYPAGASCDAHGATPTLVYPSSTPAADVYTTKVVTALTTYCPAPTQITHGGKTYTVTKATTLTITDCPCTVTQPVNKPSTQPVNKPTSVPKVPVYETKVTEVPCPVTSVQSGSTTVYTTKSSTVITGYSTIITVKNTPVPSQPGVSAPVESKPPTQIISTFLPKPTGTCPAGQVAVPAVITQIADGQPQAPGSVSCVVPATSVPVSAPVQSPSVSVDVPVYKTTPASKAPQGTGSFTTPSGPKFTGAAAALKPAGAVAAALIGAAAFL